jgi:hypothetical protein
MRDVGPSLLDLYPSQLDKFARGRHGKNKNGKCAKVEEEEEIEFLDSEMEDEVDEFEDGFDDDDDVDDEGARVNSGDHGNGDEPAETSPMVEENIKDPNGRRSRRLQKKKRLQTLY